MLKISHLYKTFDRGTVNARKALQDLCLEVEEGEFITIVGSNGAGKSTLFNAICGSFPIDQGSVFLDGKDITTMPEFRRSRLIGRLFQDPLKGTAPHMSIEENLALAYLRSGKSGAFKRITKADREFFKEQLKAMGMGLEDRLEQSAGTLSGGQRQALTLLMATIVPPKLLLLDEHTAALDPAAAENVMKLTEEAVQKNHTTCLMITHNLHQALSTGNRTLMMADGKIILDLKGKQREDLTVEQLLRLFRNSCGKDLDNDRILLSNP